MRKIYLTFVLAFMAFVGAVAQTGNYTGKLDVILGELTQSLDNQTVEITALSSNYKVTIKNLVIADENSEISIPLVEIDNIVLTPTGNGVFTVQPGEFLITVMLFEVMEQEVTVVINSGSIENNVLTLNLSIIVIPDVLEVGVTFNGSLATGIYNTAADGSKAVAYYSITGKKLATEPANGMFIVKYSNGKSVKVVK